MGATDLMGEMLDEMVVHHAHVKYVTINLDIATGEPQWSGETYGPFDDYDKAVGYGNATMQIFAVNKIHEPL